ncbi:MAG TPA: hypothetical protein VIG42_04350 [Solirubrobacteraceae bacterium]|jgi:hypothetical protein
MTSMGIIHKCRGVRLATPLLAAAIVSLVALAFASSALATKPTGDYVNFGNCPTKVTGVNLCVFATTSSGEFKIKKTTVPITKTITLQGGIILNEETGGETWVNAANGAETISKTPQTVPGGLLKILAPEFFGEPLSKIFNEFINKGITGVTATTELVGAIKINRIALLEKEANALTLPVRVHLENEFLGPKCYVGSSSKPVNVELTTGTTSPPSPNEPITGSVGELEIKDEGNLLILRKNSLVNNTFSAPTSEGCGSQILFGLFTGLIDSAVNSQLELPSASGHNTAILSGTLENATSEGVIASEK